MIKNQKTRKTSPSKRKLTKKEEFEKYVQSLEDPNYQGGSWALPENATPLEKAKYKICRQILTYKHDNNLSVEETAYRIKLSQAETEDILHYRIDYFTLDR